MQLIEKLQSSGLKVTTQRALIAKKISEFKVPFSAEDLHNQGLRKSGVDLATTYRTLALFVHQGWLTQTDLGDGRARYWPCLPKPHSHTLFCRQCQKVEMISDCLVQRQHDALLKKGFTQLIHKVEFIGICPDCAELVGE